MKAILKFIWKLVRGIFKVLFRISAFINVLVISLLLILVIFALSKNFDSGDEAIVSESKILRINLDGVLTESTNFSLLDSDPKSSFWLISKAIKQSITDAKIEAIYLDFTNFDGLSLVTANEISLLLKEFKAKGKKIYVYAPNYTASQYLAISLADEIWLDNMGGVILNGITISNLYFKDALERLKVTPYVVRAGSHKSAVEPFISNTMSDEARGMYQEYIKDVWSIVLKTIASNRSVSEVDIDNFAKFRVDLLQKHNGHAAKIALDSKLITHIGTSQDLEDSLITKYDLDKDSLKFSYKRYLDLEKRKEKKSNKKVVVVYADGAITEDGDEKNIISADLLKTLNKLENNNEVKAVVLRLNSPGGEVFASELIYRAIDSLNKVKPVVISMANVAASGGYWLSLAASEIWASSTTLTGSIGVFSMFVSSYLALNNLGINEQSVSIYEDRNPSFTKTPNSATLSIMQNEVTFVYNQFLGKLIHHKRASNVPEAINKAEGKIFSGVRAKDLKLVDNIGSIDDAIKRAGVLAKLGNDYDFVFYGESDLIKAIQMQELLKEYVLTSSLLKELRLIQTLIKPYFFNLNKALMLEPSQVTY